MAENKIKIKINRAPVLTLWGAVVAERMGYNWEEALTLGKVVAGLNAQSKGERLGIYHPNEEKEKEKEEEEARKRAPGEIFFVKVVGREVPATNTEGGVRATVKGKPVSPSSVERYLEKKFGAQLPDVRQAMEELAGSLSKQELSRRAYPLYEKFRPSIPEGQRGWGAAGELNLDLIRSLGQIPDH